MSILTTNTVLNLMSTKNAVCFVQVIECKQIPKCEIQLLLYDGQVCIKGKMKIFYKNPVLQLQKFDVIEIKGTFDQEECIIFIKEIKLHSTHHFRLLGKNMISVEDYLRKKFIDVDLDDEQQIPVNRVKAPHEWNIRVTKSVISRIKKFQKPVSIHIIDEENTSQVKLQSLYVSPHMFLADLYERMTHFEVLCRINYMRQCEIWNRKCIKMFIIDQHGDQMQCIFYPVKRNIQRNNNQETYIKRNEKNNISYKNKNINECRKQSYIDNKDSYQSLPFNIGNTVWLSNGDIVEYKTTNYGKITSIQLTSNSNVTLQLNQSVSSFNPSKLLSISEFIANQKDDIKSVVGIFDNIKSKTPYYGHQIRLLCEISDIISKIKIYISLYLYLDEEIPNIGSICIFHNVKMIKNGDIYKLQQTPLTYWTDETSNTHFYFKELKNSIKHIQIETNSFSHLSQNKFYERTLQELQEIIELQGTANSLLRCKIIDLRKKFSYDGCQKCMKKIKNIRNSYGYCMNCRRLVEGHQLYIFTVLLLENNTRIIADIFGELLQNITNMKSKELIALGERQIKTLMHHLSKSQYLIRIKSVNNMMQIQHSISSLWIA